MSLDRLPGANFNLRGLFDSDIVNAFFTIQYQVRSRSQRHATQRQLAQEEEDRELVQLIMGVYSLSIRNPAYAAAYKQCACCFSSVAKAVLKPEPPHKHANDTTQCRTWRDSQVPPVPLSPARTLSPPVLEIPMLPAEAVVPAPTAPVEP